MASRIDLLEKRLRTSAPSTVKEVQSTPRQEFTSLTVVNDVHNFANELWKDAQIFGPHQRSGTSPTNITPASPAALPPGLSLAITKKSGSSKRANRGSSSHSSPSGELWAELDEGRRRKLDSLATLYSDSLDKNMCVSILAEVELWFQLLAENYDASKSTFAPKDQIFSTVASRVYFVSRILELQMSNVLLYLDSQVCQLIYKNHQQRIPKVLRKQLEQLVKTQQENKRKLDEISNNQFTDSLKIKNAFQRGQDERVTFQYETDGRSNFLNNSDFHSFCKQRDLFYSIKDAWASSNSSKAQSSQFSTTATNSPQANCNTLRTNNSNSNSSSPSHNQSHNSFSGTPKRVNTKFIPANNTDVTVSQKMKLLSQLNSSPTNLSHLAALCLSQCILDYTNFKCSGGIEMADESLQKIFQSNPSKFKQLENRFPSAKTGGTDPLIFFKYFIDLANWAELNQHLIDRCILELYEIDASIERQEARTVTEIIESLNKARIIAQILGFLYFRPYRQRQKQAQQNTHPGQTLHSIDYETYIRRQIKLRNYHQPPIDFMEKIYNSISNRKLVFTLPWIIDFLGQADPVTFHLSSYKPILTLISHLYRVLLSVKPNPTMSSFSFSISSSLINVLTNSNQAFLRFYAGNLFSLQDFPVSVIFECEQIEDFKLNQIIQSLCEPEKGIQMSVNGNDKLGNSVDSGSYDDDLILDQYSQIGDTILNSLFEKQTSDLKEILSSTLNKSSSSTSTSGSSTVNVLSVKHTKPMPTQVVAKQGPLSPIKVISTKSKKSVVENNEMSAECTGNELTDEQETFAFQMQLESSFFQIHPPSVKRTVEFISDRIASNFVRNLRTNLYPEFKEECLAKGIYGDSAVIACQQKILSTFKEVCLPKASEAVNLLIGDCISEGALLACKQICSRRSTDKILDWVNSHINKDLFPEGASTKNSKTSVTQSQQSKSSSRPQTQVQPKFQSLVTMQQSLQKIYKRQLETSNLTSLQSVLKKEHLGNAFVAVSTSVDIALGILTFCPTLFTEEVQQSFLQFWGETWLNTHHKIKILCPRNVLIFEQSKHPDVTWTKLACLVSKLIQGNVINLKDVEEQCLGFLRYDWPPIVLRRISDLSKRISSDSSSASTRTEESEVIDWIAWACSSDGDNMEF